MTKWRSGNVDCFLWLTLKASFRRNLSQSYYNYCLFVFFFPFFFGEFQNSETEGFVAHNAIYLMGTVAIRGSTIDRRFASFR